MMYSDSRTIGDNESFMRWIKDNQEWVRSLPGWNDSHDRTNVRLNDTCITIGTKMSPARFVAPSGFRHVARRGDYAIYRSDWFDRREAGA